MATRTLTFDDLTTRDLHDVLRLRQDVFVVEQDCPYPDIDGRDTQPGTRHVLLDDDATGELVGYVRVLDDGEGWRIGRVVLSRAGRGRGLADVMMHAALEVTTGRPIVLDAQAPLVGWYATFGFAPEGEEFLEDGIPHQRMVRQA